MATWFTSFYQLARRWQAEYPFFGKIFAFLFLNFIFLLQIFAITVCYFTYVFVLCPMLNYDRRRACIYLIIYHLLLFLYIWSLFKTYFTSSAKVPEKYYVGEEIDQALKAVTPFENGCYCPEYSTMDQCEKQKHILEEVAAKKHLYFAEVDDFGRLRYCYICKLIKPDRCRHCSSCGKCILKFDHHCPFINKCISYTNYKYFVLYAFYGLIISLWSFLSSLEGIFLFLFSDNTLNWYKTFLLFGSTLFLGSVSFFTFGGLLLYHYSLILLNETTCDQAKCPIIKDDMEANYNVGEYNNIQQVFGWGIWLLPVGTYFEDGIHFEVNYSSEFCGNVSVIRCKTIKNICL